MFALYCVFVVCSVLFVCVLFCFLVCLLFVVCVVLFCLFVSVFGLRFVFVCCVLACAVCLCFCSSPYV